MSTTAPSPIALAGRRPRLATVALVAAALVLLAGAVGWIGSRGDLRSGGADRSSSSHAATPGSSEQPRGIDRSAAGLASSVGSGATKGAAGPVAPSTTSAPPATDGQTATGPAVTPKVVKTGSLDLVVKRRRFADAEQELRTIAAGAGGYVSGSSTSSSRGTPTGSLTLRVPAAQFDSVVSQVGRLGIVAASTSSSQDVTGEYTDLQSRLRAATAEREQILLVLGEAKDVPQILQVRDQLSQTQAQIEEMQGRLKVLDDQTSLSTLTVSLRERGTRATVPAKHREPTGMAKAWHDAVDRFTGGIEAVVAGSGTVLFLALLALVVWLVGRPIWLRLHQEEEAATDRSA